MVRIDQHAGDLGPRSPLAETAREYMRQAKAANTVRAYRADWEHFEAWCTDHGAAALPASATTVALYLTDLSSTHKVATLTRRLSAVSQAHQFAGQDSPTGAPPVHQLMAGLRRAKGTAPNGKAPTLTDDIRAMIAVLPAGPRKNNFTVEV